EIQRGLAQSSRCIALLSPSYVKSDACQAQWSTASQADADGKAGKLVPFLIRPTELAPVTQGIDYRLLIGLSPADVAAVVLDSVGYRGKPVDIPPGWPGGAAIDEMEAAAGGVYQVAPGADLLLERQPPEINQAADAGFTPAQLFADFA